MGKGAYLNGINNSIQTVQQFEFISGTCMNATGTPGDDLAAPGEAFEQQYIEAKSSGACASKNSTAEFYVNQLDPETGDFNYYGSFILVEARNSWSLQSSSDNVKVAITSGEQFGIYVTVS